VNKLIERIKKIILTPKTEWPVISGEPATVKDLYIGYVLPLSAIGPVAKLIGMMVFGISTILGTFRLPIEWAISQAIVHFVLGLIGVFIVSLIIDALAPTFGGTKNPLQALKVAVYTWTPAWIAGILFLLPSLGLLVGVLSLYSIYLLYLGLPVLMKAPQDKAVGYTAVVIVCAFVVMLIFSVIVGVVGGFGMPARGFGYHP
jgi:hypothetical protein